MTEPAPTGAASSTASDAELLAILAELGREVSSVLDLDALLERIPQLISRLTKFTVFSVYLLDEKREELSIAYALATRKRSSSTSRSSSARASLAPRSPSSGRSC